MAFGIIAGLQITKARHRRAQAVVADFGRLVERLDVTIGEYRQHGQHDRARATAAAQQAIAAILLQYRDDRFAAE